MKKKLFLCIFSFSLLFFSCSKPQNKEIKSTESFTAMNTYMTVSLYSSSGKKGRELCNQVHQKVDDLEKMLSVTLEESDVYKMNHKEKYDFSNDELEQLLFFCQDIYKKTGGAFNPALYPVIREWGFTSRQYKVPSDEKISELLKYTDFSKITYSTLPKNMEIDFGAVGKGYAGDKAIELLKENGIKSAILDLGGNIQTIGCKNDGKKWRVGIKSPWDDSVALALKVENCAVITSGGYERFFEDEKGKRYIHIFDPEKGEPVNNDTESVTIISSSGKYADALSTSLFVMGSQKALDFWKKNQDFEAIIITKKRQLLYTQGLKDNLEALIPFEEELCITTQD